MAVGIGGAGKDGEGRTNAPPRRLFPASGQQPESLKGDGTEMDKGLV